MLDAAELGRHLLEGKDWQGGIRAYEADMFARVAKPAAQAWEAATELSYLGLELTIQHMSEYLGAGIGAPRRSERYACKPSQTVSSALYRMISSPRGS